MHKYRSRYRVSGLRKDHGYRSIDGSGKGAVDSLVCIGSQISLRMQSLVLTDSVEDHHVIIDSVTDDGKDRRDEGLVNVKVERKYSGEQ